MNLNVEVKGIGHFEDTGTARQLALKVGIDPSVLSGLRNGKRGLSLKDARTLAPYFQTQAIGLYVDSQAALVKSRVAEGEAGKALRGLASVMEELQDLPEEDLAAEGKELRKSLSALAALVAEVLEPTDDEAPEEDTGTKKPKIAKKSRDGYGKAIEQETGKVNRDAYGKRLK
jgi:transcriptional regulator with XRE-family HTH domain